MPPHQTDLGTVPGYALGHFQVSLKLFKGVEWGDPQEVIGDGQLPAGIEFKGHSEAKSSSRATRAGR